MLIGETDLLGDALGRHVVGIEIAMSPSRRAHRGLARRTGTKSWPGLTGTSGSTDRKVSVSGIIAETTAELWRFGPTFASASSRGI
jgi:hypothetical protein